MYNEVGFGVDNFGDPKMFSTKDSLAKLIKNILFLRKGQLPSLPHIGINIRQYLSAYRDEIDTDVLKEQLAYQCSELIPFIDLTGISITAIDYNNRSTVFIIIPLNIDDSKENLLMGVTKNSDGRVIFNYKFDDQLT